MSEKGNAKVDNSKVITLIVIIVVILLIILLWWLQVRNRYPRDEFIVPNQLIVTGPAKDVGETVGEILKQMSLEPPGDPESLELKRLIDGDECPGISNNSKVEHDYVIALYDLNLGGKDIEEIIKAINDASEQENSGVRAGANFLAGAPWEIEGSPWEIEGSPWEIEGSGDGDGPGFSSADVYRDQWAWDAIDGNFATVPTIDRSENNTVRVGIFDTSPFDDDDVRLNPTQPISWLPAPADLAITVEHPEFAAELKESKRTGKADVSDHGLFVAGLVHAVAPNSEIDLIRVMEDNNRGDLFTLERQLFAFMLERSGSDDPTVINLSLGIRIPPDEALREIPREIKSLQDLMAIARCEGIVVVAAAGNNSAGLATPLTANMPADWSSVIGVAASNQEDERSCFSNQGDIAAPGGDGRRRAISLRSCIPGNSRCDGPDCQFSVAGPTYRDENFDSDFAYWAGSSFAAPMVSGLAALILETEHDLTPADVRAIIQCGATWTPDRHLGEGIINVGKTLDECLTIRAE